MWKPDICIHHFPCDDGFASAWVARRTWPDITIKGTNYGLPFPDVDVLGKNILIADFSYKSDVLGGIMMRGARSIVMLDHHKTAQADLVDFNIETRAPVQFCAQDVDGFLRDYADLGRPPVIAHFDMNRSGAALTWEFCNPGFDPPAFIAMIEDRDLWRFKLPHTRAFSLYLRSLDYDLAEWDYLATRFNGDQASVMREAAAIERFYNRKIAEILPTATLKSIGKWKGVPVAHAPYSLSLIHI